MKKFVFLVAVLGWFLIQGQVTAKSFCYVVDDFNFYPVPDTPKPEIGVPYIDPVFHTEIVRIASGGHCGYPKHDIENCDGTLIFVEGGPDSHKCFWTANPPYKCVGCIPPTYVGWGAAIDIRWDDKDPHVVYFANMRAGNVFAKYTLEFDANGDMTKGKYEVLHDFKEETDVYWPEPDYHIARISMYEEGCPSGDTRYWCFAVVSHIETHDPTWWRCGMLVYDKDYYGKDQGKVTAILKQGEPGFYAPGFTSMSPSGKYVWTGDTHRLYTRDLKFIRQMKIFTGHADMGISAEGREVIVGFAKDYSTDKYMHAMEDLETGQLTLLSEMSSGGMHVSGNCHLAPGWAVYSYYGPSYPDVPTKWGQHELVAVELTTRKDPPPKVWRVCHTHTVRKGYGDDPFGKFNKKGTRMYFTSGWGCSTYDEGCSRNIFQVNLPETWREDLARLEPSPPPSKWRKKDRQS